MTDSLQESLKIASRKFDQWKKRMQEAGYIVFGENAFKRKKDETSPSGYRDVFVTNYDKDIRKNSYGNLPASVGPKEKASNPALDFWTKGNSFKKLLTIAREEEGEEGEKVRGQGNKNTARNQNRSGILAGTEPVSLPNVSESTTPKQKLQVNTTENTSTDLRGKVVWGADEKYPLKIGGKKTSSIQKKLIDAGFSAQQLANKMEDHKDWKAARR